MLRRGAISESYVVRLSAAPDFAAHSPGPRAESSHPNESLASTRRVFEDLLRIVGVAIVYFVAAKAGLRFASFNPSSTAVWPATGIAFASMLLLGYRIWPAIFIGAFLVNATTAGSTLTSLVIATGNTLEAFIGVRLVEYFADGQEVFDHTRDIFKFIALAAIASTEVSASIGATILAVRGFAPWPNYGPVWLTWWLGDAAGNLIVAPMLVLWARQRSLAELRAHGFEGALLALSVLVAGLLVFGGWPLNGTRNYPIEFLCIIPILWAAFRFEQRETATAVAVLSAIAVAGTLHGFGPFGHLTKGHSLLLLQAFMATLAATMLPVAALVSERRRAEARAEATSSMLRRLQGVTDKALPQAGLEGLLRDLLAELRVALGSDTATVLLLEPDGQTLKPAASDGLRELIVEDTRIPVGAGVSGRIAVSDGGLIFNDLSTTEVISQYLREHVKSLLGVPLKTNGTVIGVINAGSVSPRHFTEYDLHLLQLVAHRASMAIERARLHDQERAAREAAEEASRVKDEFLAMLGHELRNPLGTISTALHLLERIGAPAEPALKARAIIARQTEHLTRIVDDLLDVARLTAGRATLRREPTNVAECVSQCIDALGQTNLFARHNFTSETDPVWVDGDPARIAQIITNLLINAVKFTPPECNITLSTRAEGNLAVVRVEDTGAGIPAEMLTRIFASFVQAPSRIDRASGGLGVGLSIARRLAELHGGTLEAASEGIGKGSTFTLRLPRIPEPRPAAESTAAPAIDATPCRVMIIEDNTDAREALREVLEASGHEVFDSGDGAAGARITLAVQPQVALIDIGLPDVDGYEVARQIRSAPEGRDVLLIALTGYGQPEDRRRAYDAGFDLHLVKPIDISVLSELIATRGIRQPRS
jgi:signal transduction histidine kinase/integral membrane sensor domain MASE1/CheY-like chemotaxis protein